VRAKVNCFRLDDELLSGEEKAKALADTRNYFALAESYRMREES
jgi:aminoglycoside phosphotransferase family enzyme